MTDYKPSIVQNYSKQKRVCGYCSTTDRFYFYGLDAYRLKVEDYQEMIDRGWRRCGKYCYKAMMGSSCCPLYTIRCAAKEFKLSKTQKKILKRFNNFLVNGTVTKDKIHKTTEIMQPMDVSNSFSIDKNPSAKDISSEVVCVDASVSNLINNPETVQEEGKISKPAESVSTVVPKGQAGEGIKKKCMKAKQLRIERKRQKLQKLGLSEEEISKKLVEKKKYPVVKTIEDFCKEPVSKNNCHNLKISLVRSWPRSEEFTNTFAVAFDLYKRYQRFIHKDAPEKLTEYQFERFLVISPLQIKLVLVESPDFKKSFNESAQLFAKYQRGIHKETEDIDALTFQSFLVETPLEAEQGYGSYHQQYWLDDKLIAVGVIDILPKCVSSVYFFYDPDYAFLSLGTYGALREVEFTRKLSSRYPGLLYYYMGFYIHSCVKMKYKGSFKPSYLLCPEVYSWHPIKECLPKLERTKYTRLNEDPSARDANADISESEVLILYDRTAMSLGYYLKKRFCPREEIEDIMEYAKLIGKACSKRMLLFRSDD